MTLDVRCDEISLVRHIAIAIAIAVAIAGSSSIPFRALAQREMLRRLRYLSHNLSNNTTRALTSNDYSIIII